MSQACSGDTPPLMNTAAGGVSYAHALVTRRPGRHALDLPLQPRCTSDDEVLGAPSEGGEGGPGAVHPLVGGVGAVAERLAEVGHAVAVVALRLRACGLDQEARRLLAHHHVFALVAAGRHIILRGEASAQWAWVHKAAVTHFEQRADAAEAAVAMPPAGAPARLDAIGRDPGAHGLEAGAGGVHLGQAAEVAALEVALERSEQLHAYQGGGMEGQTRIWGGGVCGWVWLSRTPRTRLPPMKNA